MEGMEKEVGSMILSPQSMCSSLFDHSKVLWGQG